MFSNKSASEVRDYLRFVIEESGPSNLLFVASAECVSPLVRNVPTSFSLNDASHLDPFKYREEVRVCHST